MDQQTRDNALNMLMNALRPVRHLMDDGQVQEIMVNGPDDVWVEIARKGISKTEIQFSSLEIRSVIQLLASLENKQARERGKDSIIDARMDGYRFAAVMKPTSMKGPSLSIRKHNPVHLSLDDYVNDGAVPPDMAEVLREIIEARKNIIVAGGTSSGKTTFVNSLIGQIDAGDRIVTIEDTQELKVLVPNWISLIANEQEGVTTRDLVRLSLRLRPDRIIVGEVRGGEAFDLLDAANTGHDGCLATMHASSAIGALSRFESLVLRAGINWPHEAIKAQIAETFDYVVFMARMKGGRKLSQILSLKGFDFSTKQYITHEIYRVNDQ
ncbi:CpaF family protein [Azonexus hydrophilus]|uniref:ATPase, T2SS/T4P/T4SS family n=1 Tax=Azonexus hydrophilus TaxID=418702 RepID=A0ABZ2XLP4_9RHOO